jgi:hypothetical protein
MTGLKQDAADAAAQSGSGEQTFVDPALLTQSKGDGTSIVSPAPAPLAPDATTLRPDGTVPGESFH